MMSWLRLSREISRSSSSWLLLGCGTMGCWLALSCPASRRIVWPTLRTWWGIIWDMPLAVGIMIGELTVFWDSYRQRHNGEGSVHRYSLQSFQTHGQSFSACHAISLPLSCAPINSEKPRITIVRRKKSAFFFRLHKLKSFGFSKVVVYYWLQDTDYELYVPHSTPLQKSFFSAFGPQFCTIHLSQVVLLPRVIKATFANICSAVAGNVLQ